MLWNSVSEFLKAFVSNTFHVWRDEKCIQNISREIYRKETIFKNVRVDVSVILKYILKENGVRVLIRFICLSIGTDDALFVTIVIDSRLA